MDGVLVAPAWSRSVNWAERKVVVDLARGQIKSAPECDKGTGLTVEYEQVLTAHYGRH